MTSLYDFNWAFIISTDFAKNPLKGISQKPVFWHTRFFHEDRSHDKSFTVAHIMEVDWAFVVQGRKLAVVNTVMNIRVPEGAGRYFHNSKVRTAAIRDVARVPTSI